MIDIHCHILFGLDDGARTLDESVRMIEIAAACGTTDIVATPHANSEFPFRPDLAITKLAVLRERAGDRMRIHPGSDFHLSYENIDDALKHPTKYTINHKCYLLVEFSELAILHNSRDILGRLLSAGIIPIVTHPERNELLRRRFDKLECWVQEGCMIQVTAHSFLGAFGRRAKQFADMLLRRNLIHFVASDAHGAKQRPPRLDEAYSYVCRKAGLERADRLFREHPQRAIEGVPIDPYEYLGTRRKRFAFWHPKQASTLPELYSSAQS
jgi:protein-tyrosine phosphatase